MEIFVGELKSVDIKNEPIFKDLINNTIFKSFIKFI